MLLPQGPQGPQGPQVPQEIKSLLSVCVVLPDFRDNGIFVLCVSRKNRPTRWSLPGGKVDTDGIQQAASRELQEETGLFLTDLVPFYTAFDNSGYLCVSLLGNSAGIPADFLAKGDGPFPGLEAGTFIAWKDATDLYDPDVSPFYEYHQAMFQSWKIAPWHKPWGL